MITLRTAEAVKRAVRDYKKLNSDLPKEAASLMALLSVARRSSKRALREAHNRKIGSASRDTALWIRHAMLFSNIGHLWPIVKGQVNRGGHSMWDVHRWLKNHILKQEYKTFLNRLGTPDAEGAGSRPILSVWTDGGMWPRRPYTRLLVLGKHLPMRKLHTRWQKKLGHEGIRQIERELMAAIDPHRFTVDECLERAVDYIRFRVRELTGVKMNTRWIPWFFGVKHLQIGDRRYRLTVGDDGRDYPSTTLLKGDRSIRGW